MATINDSAVIKNRLNTRNAAKMFNTALRNDPNRSNSISPSNGPNSSNASNACFASKFNCV